MNEGSRLVDRAHTRSRDVLPQRVTYNKGVQVRSVYDAGVEVQERKMQIWELATACEDRRRELGCGGDVARGANEENAVQNSHEMAWTEE
jgi:hypothetical protein